MRDVHVAADDDRLFLVQLLEVRAERVLERHAEIDAHELALGVRRIDRDEVELRVFRADHAALGVDLRKADPVRNRERLRFREHGRARVPLLFGGEPVFRIARKVEIRLLLLHFRLLQADDVRVLRLQEVGKPLRHAGPKAVYVPRNQLQSKITSHFHKSVLYYWIL